MTIKTLRRIFGIAAVLMLILSIVCVFLHGKGDHLFCQIDVWFNLTTYALIVVYAYLWIFYAVRGMHWALKLIVAVGSILLFLFCVVVPWFTLSWVHPDSKVWSNDHYVVYHKSNSAVDYGETVLYKRDGMLEKRCFAIGCEFSAPDHAEYFFFEDLDLICEEADWSFDGRHWHSTAFFRLSDGSHYEQSWHGRYSSEGDNPRQSLWVEATGDSLIFKYSVAFPDGGQPSTIVGKVAAKGGDAELDEDENGCAYWVDEYIYEKEGDWFAFRIEADSHSSVRVKADKATSAKYRIPESTLLLRTEPKKE
jgi:energy-coupling factor transporter transmembrane protein EcfT